MDVLLLKGVIIAVAAFGLLLMYTEVFDNIFSIFKKKVEDKIK